MTIPFDRVIWDAGECAEYLRESRAEFLRKTRYAEGFPAEIPSKPRRWRAIEVTAWALGESAQNAQNIVHPRRIRVPSSAPTTPETRDYKRETHSPLCAILGNSAYFLRKNCTWLRSSPTRTRKAGGGSKSAAVEYRAPRPSLASNLRSLGLAGLNQKSWPGRGAISPTSHCQPC